MLMAVSTSVSTTVNQILKIPVAKNDNKTLTKKESVPKVIPGDKFRQLLEGNRKKKKKATNKREAKKYKKSKSEKQN